VPRDVAAVGPLNIDLLITGEAPSSFEELTRWEGPADIQMTAAGSVGYLVQDLTRLGLDVGLVSCLPDDQLGAFQLDALRRAGVHVDRVRLAPETTGTVVAYVLLFGSRKRPLAYHLGTHDPWPLAFDSADRDYLLDARLLHCGGYLHFDSVHHGATTDLFREARARGLITTIDTQFPAKSLARPWLPAMDDILPYVDVLFVDEREARCLADREDLTEAAAVLRDSGPATVLVKQGTEGARVFTAEGAIYQPAVQVAPLVDSIGAGDAFDAAFLLGMLEGWSQERTARFAAVTAGFSVGGVGGSTAMPTRAQVEAYMAANALQRGDP
jgi:sugar/nucleoside kinase (ribokinase family)